MAMVLITDVPQQPVLASFISNNKTSSNVKGY
jgi:hypothetical protein